MLVLFCLLALWWWPTRRMATIDAWRFGWSWSYSMNQIFISHIFSLFSSFIWIIIVFVDEVIIMERIIVFTANKIDNNQMPHIRYLKMDWNVVYEWLVKKKMEKTCSRRWLMNIFVGVMDEVICAVRRGPFWWYIRKYAQQYFHLKSRESYAQICIIFNKVQL